MAKITIDKALLVAKSYMKQGRFEEAQKIYDEILRTSPGNKKAQQGMASLISSQASINHLIGLYQQGKFSDAISKAKILSKTLPDSILIWNLMGAANKALNKSTEAVQAFKRVTQLNTEDADGFINLGISLHDQGELGQAVEAYQKALSLNPEYAEAHFNMGNALKDQRDPQKAIKAYRKAVALKPDYAEAYNNLGIALQSQNMSKDAIEIYKIALSINPYYAEAYNNLAIALIDENQLTEATLLCRQALSLKPDYAEAYNNLGISLKEQGKYTDATQAYKKAISLQPKYAEAYYNLGNAYKHNNDEEAALDAYKKALSCKPNYEIVRADKMYLQSLICDWNGIEQDRELIPIIGTGEAFVPHLVMFSLEDEPKRHRQRAEMYTKSQLLQKSPPSTLSPRQKNKHIRIGYFSSDFQEHPVAYLISRVLELHDRDQFEVYGYSINGTRKDEIRQRLSTAFDVYKDVSGLSDSDVAGLARDDAIDIAIDLNGFTNDGRPGIFAHRAAPIQINFLGYPGTMGSDFMDYIIADFTTVPIKNQINFSEKIIFYLIHTYQQITLEKSLIALWCVVSLAYLMMALFFAVSIIHLRLQTLNLIFGCVRSKMLKAVCSGCAGLISWQKPTCFKRRRNEKLTPQD